MASRVSLSRLVPVAAAILVAATFSLSPLGAAEAEPVSPPPVDQQVTEVQEVGAAIAAWVQHEEAEAVGRLIAADAAEAQRQAELEAQRQAVATVPPQPVQRPSQPAAAALNNGNTTSTSSGSNGGFLDCVRNRESRGDYSIHNAGGSGASGAYQFMPGTWNSTAKASGRGDLVGMDPANASPADQDAMARALYAQQGAAPWGGGC